MVKSTILGLALFISYTAAAQDDLMKMLANDNKGDNDKVVATFKSTQIINANTTEFLKARNLDFRIGHKFTNIGGRSGGTIHNLYGFDQASDINIAFNYGITDNLMMGLNRSLGDIYMGFVKYGVLQQMTNNHIPVSIALYGNTSWDNQDILGSRFPDAYAQNKAYRLSYIAQAIIARKLNRNISLEILPTFFHRNYVKDPSDNNDLFALGVGGRIRVTRSSAIVADYFYTFSKLYNGSGILDIDNTSHYPSLGLGWEIETGGHVFTLMFSNNAGLIENKFLTTTTDTWTEGGFKFSFIISRVFKV